MTEEVTTVEAPAVETLQPNEYAPSVGNNIFLDKGRFEFAIRVANMFAQSSMVPKDYQRNPANCVIAFDLAARLGISPFQVMQNVSIVHGKPSIEGKLVIALINSSRAFDKDLDWEFKGEGDKLQCVCFTFKDGVRIESDALSVADVKAAGWWSNKWWQVLTKQMFRYRTASLFAKAYKPDVLQGMYLKDEADDIAATTQPTKARGRRSSLNDVIDGD